MRWKLFCCILITSTAISSGEERPKRSLGYIKNLIGNKLFGAPTPANSVIVAQQISKNNTHQLFSIPGQNYNLLIQAANQKQKTEDKGLAGVKIVSPEIAILGSYLGTKTQGETLLAVDMAKNLIKSGLLQGYKDNFLQKVVFETKEKVTPLNIYSQERDPLYIFPGASRVDVKNRVPVELPPVGLPFPKYPVELPPLGLPLPKYPVELPPVGVPIPKYPVELPPVGLPLPKYPVELPPVGMPLPKYPVALPPVGLPLPPRYVEVPPPGPQLPPIYPLPPRFPVGQPPVEVKRPVSVHHVELPPVGIPLPKYPVELPPVGIPLPPPYPVLPPAGLPLPPRYPMGPPRYPMGPPPAPLPVPVYPVEVKKPVVIPTPPKLPVGYPEALPLPMHPEKVKPLPVYPAELPPITVPLPAKYPMELPPLFVGSKVPVLPTKYSYNQIGKNPMKYESYGKEVIVTEPMKKPFIPSSSKLPVGYPEALPIPMYPEKGKPVTSYPVELPPIAVPLPPKYSMELPPLFVGPEVSIFPTKYSYNQIGKNPMKYKSYGNQVIVKQSNMEPFIPDCLKYRIQEVAAIGVNPFVKLPVGAVPSVPMNITPISYQRVPILPPKVSTVVDEPFKVHINTPPILFPQPVPLQEVVNISPIRHAIVTKGSVKVTSNAHTYPVKLENNVDKVDIKYTNGKGVAVSGNGNVASSYVYKQVNSQNPALSTEIKVENQPMVNPRKNGEDISKDFVYMPPKDVNVPLPIGLSSQQQNDHVKTNGLKTNPIVVTDSFGVENRQGSTVIEENNYKEKQLETSRGDIPGSVH